MNDQTPHKQPDNTRISETNTPQGGGDLRLRIVAGCGLGLAALLVLALAGGSLNFTSTGLTMNVNPPK